MHFIDQSHFSNNPMWDRKIKRPEYIFLRPVHVEVICDKLIFKKNPKGGRALI